MALRAASIHPVQNKENTALIGKAALGAVRGRQALGDVKNRMTKIATRSALTTKLNKENKIEPVIKASQVFNKKDVIVLRNAPAAIKNEQIPMEQEEASGAYSTFLLPPDGVPDIDEPDSNNPQLCSEYVMDIFNYMRQVEVSQSIRENPLSNQNEITGRMRSILVDWLVQVHQRFHLLQETLYFTVAILDRFLQFTEVSKCNLQLAGVSAMFLAAKYEEMYAPEINDFIYITDNAYKKKEIIKMEMAILRTLNFDLGRPLPLHFLRRNSKAGDCDSTTHTLAKYLLELCLPEYTLAHLPPSQMAAAALCLSLRILDDSPWTDLLAYYSGYKEEDISKLVKQMATLLLNAEKSKLQAVRDKYSSSKAMKISLYPSLTSNIVREIAKS